LPASLARADKDSTSQQNLIKENGCISNAWNMANEFRAEEEYAMGSISFF
jgi:hypothetical protein